MPGVLLGAALLPLLPSWLGLLGDWHWQLDLLAHFRWQYLLVGAIVLGWAAWMRQRALLGAALLTCLLNGVLIGRLAWPRDPAAAADGRALQVVSFNVLTSNPGKQAVLDYLQASDADVIFLMEVDERWMAALQPLRAEYPHHAGQGRADNFGVALFSRVPLTRAEVLDIGATGLPSIQARLQFEGRELVFIGTHPTPPIGASFAARWRRQMASLAAHVATLQQPVLLAGDLNATPWSTGMRALTAGKLRFGPLQSPWRPTWSVRSPFAIPIDHALSTAPLLILERRVGPGLGSDHRPLELSVGWSARGG